MARLRWKNKHLSAVQTAWLESNRVNLDGTVPVEQDEFVPSVRMMLHDCGETADRAGRDRCRNFHCPGAGRRRDQNRPAAEIVSMRTSAKGKDGVCSEPGQRPIDKSQFGARITAGA